MSIEDLQTKADLQRFIEQQFERPDNKQTPQPAISLTKAGVPNDEDFPAPPGNGILAVDSTGPTLYARINNAWVTV